MLSKSLADEKADPCGRRILGDDYEKSLMRYWELQSVVETAVEEAVEKAVEKNTITIAREMRKNGESMEKIMLYTGLSKAQIEKL